MADQLRERIVAALGELYDIEGEIGRGGMGVVYRGKDKRLRRPVAIKVLPPELAYRDDVKTRFLREAQTAAQLNHPNIVPIFSVDERESLVWFIMALVSGESLGARLAADRRPSIAEVRRILSDVADALAYAHERGIIHRDIKPDNILLDRDSGRAMVTDFGIARAVEGDSRLTVTGVAVGTPAYMSPEQALGEHDIDGRSDLYALAVVGYQMLAGELPFQAANTPAMLMKHIGERPKPLGEVRRDLPPALVFAIERAMSKKAVDRWASAAEFRQALLTEMPPPVALPGESPGSERVSSAWKRPALKPTDAERRPPRETGRSDVPARLPRLSNASSPRRSRGAGLDAVSAANAGWPGAPNAPAPNHMPSLPPWMPASWREARRQWHDQQGKVAPVGRGRGKQNVAKREAESITERIRTFRKRVASSGITVGALFTVNMLTSPEAPWFLFPAAFFGFRLLHNAASLWSDGIRMSDIFGRKAREALKASNEAPASAPARQPSLGELAERLAPAEVVAGPYGPTVRKAAADRAEVHAAIGRLSKADRALIPDVGPTVDALAERVGSIAYALHRLDEDIAPDALAQLDERIRLAREHASTHESAQKLTLLERQRTTLAELVKRRDTLVGQMESASLMLQNMRLDLVALRSAGVQSALDDVTSATQEARALSREIANVLDAAKQIR
jgi:serine/threonine-protein kinase